MTQPQPQPQSSSHPSRLTALEEAITRCEQTHLACEAARAALDVAAPGEAFAAAWSEYERYRAAYNLAWAEAQIAREDAQAAIP